ncbi:tRNA (adenosine(37)-N6)-threonylcarbamoyltransferase complex dimerization subunit type 1 TsaB [Neolewinella persica]|uniref:tRNA (adenosine(37)-N6)-threonylcarbamoyltransferase complex dimerization subunit type 1 TsaB n=1 Tax=Neolewinella persica TaxID=70998 RepID=UPI00036FA9D4|nr:tRNA (adenosine(37)-N6)-threonylcarbamoyltransferase complex dimerization subunit type 1 TsaB [Neolewinella persica]
MTQLLLETATDVCSVAIARDGVLLAEHTATESHQHSSHLTLFIQQVIQGAKIDITELEEVVLSDGPGSYTSLRVGGATAKGLCLALPGLQLRVVPTLAALAVATGVTKTPVLATINSRKGEVFGQLFLGAGSQVQSEFGKQGIPPGLNPLILGPTNIRLTEEDWHEKLIVAAGVREVLVCGSGQGRVLEAAPADHKLIPASPAQCSASHLLAPAASPDHSHLVDVASYEPFYLNAPFVTKSKKKLLG